jgi:hypothetical protein
MRLPENNPLVRSRSNDDAPQADLESVAAQVPLVCVVLKIVEQSVHAFEQTPTGVIGG